MATVLKTVMGASPSRVQIPAPPPISLPPDTLERMSVVQRDYIERLIEQAAQAIAQIIQLVRAGDLDPALIVVQKTRELVLGPMRPVLERVDAASAVYLVGKYELDRLRMYAALLGEEGTIHQLRGHTAR